MPVGSHSRGYSGAERTLRTGLWEQSSVYYERLWHGYRVCANPLCSSSPPCRGLCSCDVSLGKGFHAQELSVAAFPDAGMMLLLGGIRPSCAFFLRKGQRERECEREGNGERCWVQRAEHGNLSPFVPSFLPSSLRERGYGCIL